MVLWSFGGCSLYQPGASGPGRSFAQAHWARCVDGSIVAAAVLCVVQAASPWPSVTADWLAWSLAGLGAACTICLLRRRARRVMAGTASAGDDTGADAFCFKPSGQPGCRVDPSGGLISHAWISSAWIVLKTNVISVENYHGEKESVFWKSHMSSHAWSRLCFIVAALRYDRGKRQPSKEPIA